LKTLIKTALFLLILFCLAYFGANYVLKNITVRAIAELKPRLEQKGINIEKFNYSNVHVNSYNSFSVANIDLDFHLNKKMYGKESFKAKFDAKSITIRFADFNNPSLFFTLKDFSLFVEPDEANENRPFGKLENGYLQSRIPIYMKSPEESAREILDAIKTLFLENKTPVDLKMEVDVLLGLDEKEIKVGLFTERIDQWTHIKFEGEEILKAAKEFDLDLSKKESEIIANYPSKVPSMIKITRDAKRISKLEFSQDQEFPEDAYRHIYWSYHLTQTLGPELAKEITDAHETAPGNTKNERLMDYHNNEVGRKYANENLSINEMKNRVLNSKDIIRHPDSNR